ncbi:hypothetical protein [Streptomyces shenzhenensis]|uniref:hypothetical protein n=1 Tax=Streptomyces TaxID=1883 RepID=UPI001F17C33B|nr:hypothetical protein [Streptomyces shenzhenensis]
MFRRAVAVAGIRLLAAGVAVLSFARGSRAGAARLLTAGTAWYRARGAKSREHATAAGGCANSGACGTRVRKVHA